MEILNNNIIIIILLNLFILAYIVYLIKFNQKTPLNRKDLDSLAEATNLKSEVIKNSLNELNKTTVSLHTRFENSQNDVKDLNKITADLKSILSNNQKRGKWAEHRAENILKYFGLNKPTDYDTQLSQGSGRPDFTFFFNDGLKKQRLNMDVKYPFANYESYCNAINKNNHDEANVHLKELKNDIKRHIKEISERDGYVDTSRGTLDFCIMYVEHEELFNIIFQDMEIMDRAKKAKIVICGPIALYAIISLINQALETLKFNSEQQNFLDAAQALIRELSKYDEKAKKLENLLTSAQDTLFELNNARLNAFKRKLRKLEFLNKEPHS